jgi:xanthine dehydrogenase accessory factor
MNAWLPAALQLIRNRQAAVLITVVRAEGSTPREAGARMLASAQAQWDTIGGGHLEWRALELARALLRDPCGANACRMERLSLGPSLGQCCGGAVTVLFERLAQNDLSWLEQLDSALRMRRSMVRRREVLDAAGHAVAGRVELTPAETCRSVAQPMAGTHGREESGCAPDRPARRTREAQSCALVRLDGKTVLAETLTPAAMHVVLFGAGHVGHAIVRMLAALPCTVSWVDERDAQFPDKVPDNVEIEDTDTPEAVVAQAPAGSYFLVMTHCHALDQRLCREIFRRDDFAYFGLIGSRTKRRKFEHRLRERGVDPARFDEMICPIGVEGIHGKAPEVIAVSVVAQLLQVQEMRAAAIALPQPVTGPALRLSAHADELVYIH